MELDETAFPLSRFFNMYLCINQMLQQWLCILCTDTGPTNVTSTSADFQKLCVMRTFVSNPHESRIEIHGQAQNICLWRGVTCDNAEVIFIEWGYDDHFEIKHLDWLPPTLQIFKLEYHDVGTCVCTRAIPRAMYEYAVVHCSITGTVDLRTLPEYIALFDMRHNFLSGTVSLDLLPITIQVIQLEGNTLRRVYVDSRKLPNSLVRATFRNPTIQIIQPKGQETCERVFIRKR